MTTVKTPYSQAISSSKYKKEAGLFGKYDNVRRYWEDEVLRLFIRPCLKELIIEKKKNLERLRILDMGCGIGDGYDLLMYTPAKDIAIDKHETQMITDDLLGFYKGFDINKDFIKQADQIYSHTSDKIMFKVNDFSDGLTLREGRAPYDIYFTSYGTLSHNTDEQTEKLFIDIVNHTKKYSLVIGGWLGRYSYEWQTLWSKDFKKDKSIDYVISYIYPEAERKDKKLDSFKMMFMSKEELEAIIENVNKKVKRGKIIIKKLMDGSTFVGRHMDTGDYNPYVTPIRKMVNSLFEVNYRTNLNSVLLNYHPKKGFNEQNKFFERLQMCWNTLTKFTLDLLLSYDPQTEKFKGKHDIYSSYPVVLKNAMATMKKVIENVSWMKMGDIRANVIEQQLAYVLRGLEMELQQGMGCGHNFVGLFEIRK